jgi:N-acetylmuramoyl-L-alanine amidase/putative methionine-R-sulfoxide reductase with GAF domain
MATIPTKPGVAGTTPLMAASVPAWPLGPGPHSGSSSHSGSHFGNGDSSDDASDISPKPTRLDALQALIAFSALHEQIRRRKALAAQHKAIDAGILGAEFDEAELFVLDEVLQLVAERAIAITGADGLAIALAENNEIVLRASAGMVRPDVGARIDRDSAFSGASFRMAQIVNCDDTETDARVNLQACRRLGARSMVAVPLCGRRRVIGLLEAFSTWPFGFNDADVRNLTLLAELIVSALKPEDEDRFADSAQVAATKLEPPRPATPASIAPPVIRTEPVAPPAHANAIDKVALPPIAPSPAVTSPIAASPAVAASTVAAPVQSAPAPVVAAPAQTSVMTTPAIPVEPAKTKAGVPDIAPLVEPVPVEPNKIESKTIEPKTLQPKAAEPKKPEPRKIESAAFDAPFESAALQLPKVEAPVAAETSHEPALTFGQEPDTARPKSRVLILLICIVVGVAFAAGVWWKYSQLGSTIVTDKTIADKSTAKPADAASSDVSKSTTATGPNTATTPNSASDTISGEPAPTPATPQELAKFPRVTGIRHWSSADSSTVVLDLEDQVQYEAHRLTGPDRIYFDLHDTQLAPELAGKAIDIGDTLLNRIRVAQPVAGMTRVVLETRGDSNFSVSLEPNPYRLVVEVRKLGSNPHGAVNLFPNAEAEKNRLAIVVPPPTKEDLLLRARVPKMRIVVDAGHGGWDLGTVGRRGLLEKDLVLEIAERLGKLLESRLGSEVVLTRNDDNYIPLDERAEIANQAQADLFVSVHANYSDLPSARGVETYYTNSFSAPGSKEPGLKDASTSTLKNAPTPTLSAADLHERIEQSRRLAASVQRALYGTLVVENPGLRDRGIKEAGFVVLTESAMPGILAEVSFVSSPTDEQKLRSDGYREQIAEALYRGIARYAASSKGVKVAAK